MKLIILDCQSLTRKEIQLHGTPGFTRMIPMSPQIFKSHYGLDTDPPATHLCFEVYNQGNQIASGHFTNSDEEHAEEVFIGERFRDEWKNCTIVWYISWSPCDNCIQILLNNFLSRNPLVKLQINFAKLHRQTSKWNVRMLYQRGVRIRVMDQQDFHRCWTRFVETEERFVGWNMIMYRNYHQAFQWLCEALSRQNLCYRYYF
ncbi:C-_U-editing enzyme APOBEC-1-like [Pyxicephalus adspersus]|uniref:C->U-editing enzyme APOBEC-1-like n=1 Tax=Pyxicephalus adspersus TaxID=30357 RepID=UPI003B5A109A